MEINQRIENAIKLADLDMNHIQHLINVEFDGSIDAYLSYVRRLSIDFESALALLVLTSNTIQINSFISVNLTKIQQSIQLINIFEGFCSRSEKEISCDPVNNEIINGFFRPIHATHLSHLLYIEKQLKNVLNTMNCTPNLLDVQPELINEVDETENDLTTLKLDFLSSYPDILSMKDMCRIFNVKRNAIINKEKAGYFKRCTPKNQNVGYRKLDIAKYLSIR